MILNLDADYSRRDVHGIFSPHTTFTPQAGTWGLHGIVSIPDRDNDFVFFVTLGQQQGKHVFDEGINEDGVLTWQSQPSQTLDEERIVKFINHDDSVHNIYLFFRTKKGSEYKYYGRLGYLTHDTSREKPVYFQWQLLDWDELDGAETTFPFEGESIAASSTMTNGGGLTQRNAPAPKASRTGTDKQTFRSRKVADYAARDERNRKLGLLGEKLVLEYEKKRLSDEGLMHLAEAVLHTSVVEGDGAGYDIRSFGSEGKHLFIEVKTTRGGADTDFFMSINEVRFAEQHADRYCLYRVYNFDMDTNTAEFYVQDGAFGESSFRLSPTNFRVSLDMN